MAFFTSYDKDYENHEIFKQLHLFSNFYSNLSYSTMNHITAGVKNTFNIDSYIFSSIKGTIDSIREILSKGRINDAYALLRKYYDSTLINIYTTLYLKKNSNLENFIVDKINNWVEGKEKIPRVGAMSKYILNSPVTSDLTPLFYDNNEYKCSVFENIKERCNSHVHYNYFTYMLLNDNELFIKNKVSILGKFSEDLMEIFILHISYLFYINDHYMMANDYIDSIDLGLTPEPDSQYFVAPFIQEIYDMILKPRRPDVAKLIKDNTGMQLE